MEWLWILLFGSFVSLSDQPINLAAGSHDIPLKKPLSAITSGASLYIEITSMVPKDEMTIDGSRRWVEKNVTHGCLKAALRSDGSTTVPLEFRGGYSFEPGSLFLILAGADATVSVRQDFKKLSMASCMPLRQVRLYWRNYQK